MDAMISLDIMEPQLIAVSGRAVKESANDGCIIRIYAMARTLNMGLVGIKTSVKAEKTELTSKCINNNLLHHKSRHLSNLAS